MESADDENTPLETRLAHYANLMAQHGLDSTEAEEFRRENEDDEEFTELAEVARQVAKALRRRAAR